MIFYLKLSKDSGRTYKQHAHNRAFEPLQWEAKRMMSIEHGLTWVIEDEHQRAVAHSALPDRRIEWPTPLPLHGDLPRPSGRLSHSGASVSRVCG